MPYQDQETEEERLTRLMSLPQQNRPMIVPQLPPSIQAQPQNYPDFSRIPIQAAAPSPAEASMSQLQLPDRSSPEYNNSRLRTVLNAIAGGLAGASGGPKAGLEVGSSLRDAKYNQAMSQYRNRLELLGEQQKGEEKQFERGAKEVQSGVQRGVAQVGANYKERQATIGETNAETKKGEAVSKDKLRADTILNRQKKLDQLPPEVRTAQWFQQLDPEGQESYADFELAKHPQESPESAAAKTTAKDIAHANVAVSPLGQQAAAVTTGTKTTAADAAHANAPLNATSIQEGQAAIDRANDDPDQAYQIAQSLSPDAKKHFWTNYTGPAKKLNAEETKNVNTAKTAIAHVNTVMDMIKDPVIQNAIGPLTGRISQLYQALGGRNPSDIQKNLNSLDLNKGLAPESKEAKFLDMLKYLVLFEASTVSGSRPSWQLVKELKETQGAKFNLNRTIGNLEAARSSATNRIESIYRPSSQGKPTDKSVKKTRSGFEEIK